TWTANSLGTQIKLANGRGMGSSPYVKWVPAGGPNGMVIVSSKWAVDSSGNISGGQNFYVNYNYGQGSWEQLPYAVTYDSSDTQGGYFAGFAQSFDTSVDGLTLFQATDVENTTSSQSVSVNGGSAFTLSYPATVDWNRYRWAQFTASLNAGNNTITFTHNSSYAELDAIDVYQSGAASHGEFKLVNRNSGKYLEIPSASTTAGTQAGQWGDTNNPTQVR